MIESNMTPSDTMLCSYYLITFEPHEYVQDEVIEIEEEG